jgi:hypothetical protein
MAVVAIVMPGGLLLVGAALAARRLRPAPGAI